MNRETAKRLIETYGRAWMTQDPDLIVTIFTDDATYNDPHEPENVGLEAIRKYWETKVVGEQKDIHFKLKNLWLDGDTVVAEWDASFIDKKRNLRIKMTEVAIFGVRGEKFSSLREFYKSVKEPI